MQHRILVAGAGKIGSLIACLLLGADAYDVHLVDLNFVGADILRLRQQFPVLQTAELNVRDEHALRQYLQTHKITAVISSLPYFCNIDVARVAKEQNVHYFDLTEDTQVTAAVKAFAADANSAFVPQCGLAPGFISITANSLMQEFDSVDEVKMRVGALPSHASNELHYSLTWSTDGVINEYGNPCHAIEYGNPVILHPLEGLESIQIDGLLYEAFNTSGGLGSLPELYQGKVRSMNYKTIRYPGHCAKMRFLMNDLRMNEDRAMLKTILERVIPKTYQDVVLIYVSVTGKKQEQFLEKNYTKKIYPVQIAGLAWSAIQITTAAGICAVVDEVLSNVTQYRGLILQESFSLATILKNRFGRYYA